MKIALVILHADPSRGGAERYTVDLAHALAERGCSVTVLASTFARLDERIIRVSLPGRGATKLRGYLRFLDALDAHLAGRTYDIVHAMLPVRRCDVYHPHAGIAADAVRFGHLKHRGRLHQTLAQVGNVLNRKRQRFAAIERALLSLVDGRPAPVVLCLSEYVKKTVRRHYRDLPGDRLVTLFNATDLVKFDPAIRPDAGHELRARLDLRPDAVVALMIAQDFARKGLREAILAWRRVNDPRLVLLVVGRDDPRPYQRMVAGPFAANVIFAGPTDDPYACYRAADFFVLPTRHDPCSLGVLEALAMGVPVISTRFNGACEIMVDGTHGFVLPDPADVGALARAMGELLSPETRAIMSAACRALRPSLAYESHVERLLDVYAGKCRPVL